jgi:tRNA(fMet)-specific endonuclease VapC
MTRLLDTDMCIGVLRQRPRMVARLSQLPPTDCGVSSVTVYELFCGVGKAQNTAAERQKIERFLSVISELPFDRGAAEAAANIRVDLEKRGMVIGPYELLIAGCALSKNLTLVTNNVGEFQRVTRLKLELWP